MTVEQFAEIANMTPRKVSEKCGKIYRGEFKVLKELREWNLVAVELLPDGTWSLRVKVKEKR
jgi:hypothetical protein